MQQSIPVLVTAGYACMWLAVVLYAAFLVRGRRWGEPPLPASSGGRVERIASAPSRAGGMRMIKEFLRCQAERIVGSTYAAASNQRSISRWESLGSGAAAAGWVFLFAALAARGVTAGHWPLTTRYEFALCFAWAILGVYLLLELRWRDRRAGAFVMAAALLVMTFALLRPAEEKAIHPLLPALRSVWLQFHVVAAAVGYGACAVAAGLAAAQLAGAGNDSSREHVPRQETHGVIANGSAHSMSERGATREAITVPEASEQERFARLRGTKPSRLSPAEDIERQVERVIGWAFPWLTAVLLTGAIWAQDAWGRYWGWDPKETWALITWLWYLLLLHTRELRGWRGRRLAWLTIAGFGIVFFAFAGLPWLLRTVRLTTLHGF
jgi:cytochrome c-type biogenesis protein CcsB